MKPKALLHERILDYVDGPVVIEARDEDGRRYLCDSLGDCEAVEQFLVVSVTNKQVEDLNRGDSCLRRTMECSGRDKWYISVPQWDFRKPFVIERQTGSISEHPDLCGESYMLTGAWDD